MKNYFNQKVVIVTGSTMGIGKAVAFQLGMLQAKVVLNGRNALRLQEILAEFRNKGIDCIGFEGDITDESNCRMLLNNTIAHYGKIDALVNNAGVGMRAKIENLTSDTISKLYQINAIAPITLSVMALPFIKESKGSIVFISSLTGLRGLPNLSVYGAAKMSLTAFAQALRVEQAAANIHLGIVYVGITQVETGKTALGADGMPVPLESRKGILVDSIEMVSDQIVQHLYSRKKRTIIGVPGKLFYFITKYFPNIFEYLLIKSQRKVNNLYK